jgi:hypothetical protein
MQLTPQVLFFCGIEEIDWATLLVFSCPFDCSPGEFVPNCVTKVLPERI